MFIVIILMATDTPNLKKKIPWMRWCRWLAVVVVMTVVGIKTGCDEGDSDNPYIKQERIFRLVYYYFT